MKIPLIIFLLLGIFGLRLDRVSAIAAPSSEIPDDVRYLLEDLYGAKRDKWPSPVFAEDVNGDGFPDWVAQSRGCRERSQCAVEVFLCKPGAEGKACADYCYLGSGRLQDFRATADPKQCESTC